MTNFDAIIKLHNMLESSGIEHGFRSMNGGYQVVYPTFDAWDAVLRAYHQCPRSLYCRVQGNAISVVLTPYSWGRDEGKLEIMGMLTDDELVLEDVAAVTVEEAFRRIAEAEENKREVMGV